MTKFSLKKQEAVQRVKEGYSIAQVARETGISRRLFAMCSITPSDMDGKH